jgi:hypothetical protein
MKRFNATILAVASVLNIAVAPGAFAADATLDPGTRMFLTLDESVSSARGGADVGAIVRCRVWRDVESRGVVIIKAGAPATCRVDKVKRRNMGGTEGSVSIGGVETHSADGQLVMLSGGYNKEGTGHKALVWTAGLLLFFPVLFIPGGNAELPPGTVFDVETVNSLKLDAPDNAARRVVNLSALGAGLSADFMLDDFLDQPKHDTFRIKLSKDGQLPSKLVIDSVNGKTVDPLPLQVTKVADNAGEASGVGEISAKTLAKHFARGINRFDVAYTEAGERKATEVVMDVQM